MNKITAEKCREILTHFKSLNIQGHLLEEGKQILQALEIALQVLEAEPVADVVAWNHPSEERKCSVQLRRFDLKPGPLFMLAPQTTTDTYRQIENDDWIEWGGGACKLPGNSDVEIRQRGGRVIRCKADMHTWWWRGGANDIIAYRVIEMMGGKDE
ncbi:hypothetical protein [Pantoea sp. X85]|uniref:hypothetical protein n=1 Tax=Pantoea sp. X85 TaxID=3037258 RepID=UPI002413AC19|nr:hypothetical protein [Pantoea sp. X85]WFL66397.1 hypothetical protein P6287_13575 [Pantoea sp. X85]